jgi:hypothetical protein
MHSRPEALGNFGGMGPLDPAGPTSPCASRSTWKYHGITPSGWPRTSRRPREAIARRLSADHPGAVPAGAFPDGWVPTR